MSKANVSVRDEHEFTAEDLANGSVHISRTRAEQEVEIDNALGLQAISIRLPKKLIDELKFIARVYGVGYQPLVRNHLEFYAESEMKMIKRDLLDDFQVKHAAQQKLASQSATTKESKSRKTA